MRPRTRKAGRRRLADRPSRRGPLIVGGYFLAAAVRPIIAMTAAAWQVVVLRSWTGSVRVCGRRRATR